MTIRHLLALAAVIAGSIAVASPPATAQESRLLYAGFLQDAQVMTVKFDLSVPDQSSYSVDVGGDLIGILASMYPFHMQLTSQGRLTALAAAPSHFRSDIAAEGEQRVVTLTYGA